jgi:hypothetical protein
MHINGSFVNHLMTIRLEKLSTQTTAVITSPRMTTSRISEKSSPTQPSVPATTGKQRID